MSARFSRSDLSPLYGGQFTAAFLVGHREPWKPHDPPPKPRVWSVLLDLGADTGTHHKADVTQYTVAVGTRRTLAERHNDTYLPYAQVLLGYNHNQGTTLVRNHASLVFGGGLDVLKKARPHSEKYVVAQLGARFQAEWVEPFGVDANGYSRFSAGIVVRLGEHAFDR
jgi:hypothetical protein